MPKGYHHLTRDQRCQIYTLKKRGDAVSGIAQEVGCHRSAIYREIARNSGKKGYRFKEADEKAQHRRRKSSLKRPKMTDETILSRP